MKKFVPRDAFPISVDRAAELFRVSAKTIREWIRADLPVLREGGKGRGRGALIDLEAMIAWYFDNNSLEAEKTRLARAQADRVEMDVELRAGRMLDRDDTLEWISNDYANVKARLMQIPAAVSASLPSEFAAGVAAEVRGLVYEALEELSAESRMSSPVVS